MAEIFDFDAERRKRVGDVQSILAAHPAGGNVVAEPDDETEASAAFNDHREDFLTALRDNHPDQFPWGVAYEAFRVELDEKYGPGWPDMSDSDSTLLGTHAMRADKEERRFESRMLADERVMIFHEQLPDYLLPCIEQQMTGDRNIPESLQAVLWHGRYERFLPEIDNPFHLDQS